MNTPKWYNVKTARTTKNPAILSAILQSGNDDEVVSAASLNPIAPTCYLEAAGYQRIPAKKAAALGFASLLTKSGRPARPSSRPTVVKFSTPEAAVATYPDSDRYKHRFDVTGSSGRIYRVSYDDAPGAGYWTCSCPGNICHGDCKHLQACGLMGRKQAKTLGIRAPKAASQLGA